jgi:hypothetical protein
LRTLARATEEPRSQQTERESAADKRDRITARVRLNLGQQLVGITLAQVAGESLDLLCARIGVLAERWL